MDVNCESGVIEQLLQRLFVNHALVLRRITLADDHPVGEPLRILLQKSDNGFSHIRLTFAKTNLSYRKQDCLVGRELRQAFRSQPVSITRRKDRTVHTIVNHAAAAGFKTLAQAEHELQRVDGVMIGREAYQNPWILADADCRIYGERGAQRKPADVVRRMLPFVDRVHRAGIPVHRVTRHMLGLFQGRPGARAWRRYLSEHAHVSGAGSELLERALQQLPRLATRE